MTVSVKGLTAFAQLTVLTVCSFLMFGCGGAQKSAQRSASQGRTTATKKPPVRLEAKQLFEKGVAAYAGPQKNTKRAIA